MAQEQGAYTECHIVPEALHGMCDCVHMYTQPHSQYSSVPCCLAHVTLEFLQWHLGGRIGYYNNPLELIAVQLTWYCFMASRNQCATKN